MSVQQMLLDCNATSHVQMDVEHTSVCMYVAARSAGLMIVHCIKCQRVPHRVIRAHSYIASFAVSAAMKCVYRAEARYQRFLADSTCSLSALWRTPVQIARAFRRKKLMAEVMGGGKSRQQLLNRHADRSVPLPTTSTLIIIMIMIVIMIVIMIMMMMMMMILMMIMTITIITITITITVIEIVIIIIIINNHKLAFQLIMS